MPYCFGLCGFALECVGVQWWSNRETTRTLKLPLIQNAEDLGISKLLKTTPPPTALELAERYRQIMTENGHLTNKELAEHLGKPYRTIKSVMKLLSLSEPAKQLLRDASKNPRLRPRLSRGLLEPIPVLGTSIRKQLASLREHLK